MSPRQNWFWLILAASLAVFIFIHNRYLHSKPIGPMRVVPGLLASSVTSLSVRPRGESEIRVERTNGTWVLTDPLVYPGQSISIENLLEALEKLSAATHISAAELGNRPDAEEEYGLSNPEATIIIQGNVRERIVLGTNTAPGNQIFLKVGRDNGVFVVDRDLLRLVPRNANDWRDTAFFEPGLFSPDHIAVTNGQRSFELERIGTNTSWRLLFPGFAVRADNSRVEEMVQGIRSIRVHDFVTDEPKAELENFGLHSPALQLAFRSGTNTIGLLQFGKEVTNSAHQVYARRAGQSSIVTVARDLIEPWRSAEKFRDPYLNTFSGQVSSIEVQGQDNFNLEEDTNHVWWVTPQRLPADPALVKDLLSGLVGMQIASFVRDLVPKADLATYGLTNPSLRYVVKVGPNPTGSSTNTVTSTNEIRFGATQEDKVFVQRTDEGHVYAVKLADVQQLGSASWQFRNRQIWKLNENDVSGVTIHQHGRTRKILRRAQYEWALASGSTGIIEPLAVDQTVAGMCNLAASVWVARGEQHRVAYGLTNEIYTITLDLKNGDSASVELGRPSPSSFPYGAVKLDGDLWIFEFPLKLCRDMLLYLGIPTENR